MTMGILGGNPKEEPMHYGEVFGVWMFLTAAKGIIAGNQTHLNHAGDEDLRKLLAEVIQASQQEVKQIETLLKNNGVGLPPTPSESPHASRENIPSSARCQDLVLAVAVSGESA